MNWNAYHICTQDEFKIMPILEPIPEYIYVSIGGRNWERDDFNQQFPHFMNQTKTLFILIDEADSDSIEKDSEYFTKIIQDSSSQGKSICILSIRLPIECKSIQYRQQIPGLELEWVTCNTNLFHQVSYYIESCLVPYEHIFIGIFVKFKDYSDTNHFIIEHLYPIIYKEFEPLIERIYVWYGYNNEDLIYPVKNPLTKTINQAYNFQYSPVRGTMNLTSLYPFKKINFSVWKQRIQDKIDSIKGSDRDREIRLIRRNLSILLETVKSKEQDILIAEEVERRRKQLELDEMDERKEQLNKDDKKSEGKRRRSKKSKKSKKRF